MRPDPRCRQALCEAGRSFCTHECTPPLQDEDDEVLRGGIEALRGHVLAFPKEAARGAMDRNMDDVDNLVVRMLTPHLYGPRHHAGMAVCMLPVPAALSVCTLGADAVDGAVTCLLAQPPQPLWLVACILSDHLMASEACCCSWGWGWNPPEHGSAVVPLLLGGDRRTCAAMSESGDECH